jgi:hypothetical protein
LNVNNDIKQVLAALDRLVAAHQRGPWDYVSIIAILLTLIVLIWYTIETYKLRVAAVNQLGVAITPIVMIAPIQEAKGAVPAIRNVGNGPAFNISIESGNIGEQSKLTFFHSDVLAGNELQVLHLTLQQPERERQMFTHDDIVTNIAQGHLPPTLPLTITYNGANGQGYTTMMAIEVRSELLCYQFGKHTAA